MGQGLEWIADNMDLVRAMCWRQANDDTNVADELFSVCVDYADRVADTYDAAYGTRFVTHMYANLKWYVYKAATKPQRVVTFTSLGVQDAATLENIYEHAFPDLDAGEQVQYVWERLTEFEYLMIYLRHIDGMTFAEIGEVTGVSKNTACGDYERAIARARSIACERWGDRKDERLQGSSP